MEINNEITDFLNESVRSINSLKDFTNGLRKTIDILKEKRLLGNKIFICGNGGSASTASHFACDLLKQAKMKAMSLNDNIPSLTAFTNDYGWNHVYEEALKRLYCKGDVLVVISTHGGIGIDKAGIQSSNLLSAIRYVKKYGGIAIGLSGMDGGSFDECDINIIVKSKSVPIIESIHSVVCHLIAFEI